MGLLAAVFGENYRYHDTPEGRDCFDKLFYVTKYAACYGILYSSADVTLFSHPKGYGPTLARYAYLTIPAIGVAAAWTGTVCAATNIRNKDDHWNFVLGGVAAGALIGAWRKSVKVGGYSALIAAFLSVMKKEADIHDWPIFMARGKTAYNDIWSVNTDYSLKKDYPKTWSTAEQ